jgi:membrane fusion protein, multidrug efflux system
MLTIIVDNVPAIANDRRARVRSSPASSQHSQISLQQGRPTMRYFLPILGLLIVIGGLGGIKFAQISSLIAFGKAAEAAGPPPEAVGAALTQELSWEGQLSAVGSVVAERGVSVSNDSPGVVKAIKFDSGDEVKKGQVLVELDTGVERAQLASAQARRDLAMQTAERTRKLAASQTVTQAKVDTDEAQLKTAETELSALSAQIDRKVVRAAFTGRLGIRQVNLGQYLAPGSTLTTLEALDSVFVDFTLPQQSLHDLTVGLPVRVTVNGNVASGQPLVANGTIAAVDPSVDATTRSIKVRAAVPNPGQKLRPGMFVDVGVLLPKRANVVAVPQTAVVHASYGDSVFIVEAPKAEDKVPPGTAVKVARQQFVRLGESRGDFIAVVDGVKVGQQVVTQGAFKLHNGARVLVNDKVPLQPKVSPTPENQ